MRHISKMFPKFSMEMKFSTLRDMGGGPLEPLFLNVHNFKSGVSLNLFVSHLGELLP